jgi:GNAT superfamily N-acetyltransferase
MAVVRRARPDDASALARIHIAAWRAAYRGVMPDRFLDGLDLQRWTDRWQQTLGGLRPAEQTPAAVLVVEGEIGEPAGFAMTGPERTPAPPARGRGELWAINLAPDAWGHGLGQLLLGAAERALAEAGHVEAMLWVVATNERARRFYGRAGWGPDGAERRDAGLGFEVHEVCYVRRLAPA